MKITFGPNDYIEIVGSGENPELTKWGLDVCKFALERRIELEKAKPETPVTEDEADGDIERPEIWQCYFQKNKKGVKKTKKNQKTPTDPVTESITEDITDDSCEIDRCICDTDDKRTLMKDFYESPFYEILKEIMRSDMDKVKCKVSIKESCTYFPVIDFNTGVRVICIDSEILDRFKIYPVLIDRKIPFSFRIPKSGVKTRIIYSDICRESPMVIALSLKKLIIG